MASSSLQSWRKHRSERLDELINLKKQAVGATRGRKWGVGEFNQLFVLKLCAEFQGFARDLHLEATVAFRDRVHLDPDICNVVYNAMTLDLQLERANARPESIKSDFKRLGIVDIRNTLVAHSSESGRRLEKLERMNTLRNGIAHQDTPKIEKSILWWNAGTGVTYDQVVIGGEVPTLTNRDLVQMRSALNGLAKSLDAVVRNQLVSLFPKESPPWGA